MVIPAARTPVNAKATMEPSETVRPDIADALPLSWSENQVLAMVLMQFMMNGMQNI